MYSDCSHCCLPPVSVPSFAFTVPRLVLTPSVHFCVSLPDAGITGGHHHDQQVLCFQAKEIPKLKSYIYNLSSSIFSCRTVIPHSADKEIDIWNPVFLQQQWI